MWLKGDKNEVDITIQVFEDGGDGDNARKVLSRIDFKLQSQ